MGVLMVSPNPIQKGKPALPLFGEGSPSWGSIDGKDLYIEYRWGGLNG